MHSDEEIRLEIENLDLRRLLAKAGIDAAELRVAAQLQRVLLEELHHRVKNTLAAVMAITSQTLRNAQSIDHAREAISNRLLALGRVHDLLLRVNWSSTPFVEIVKTAVEPYDREGETRFDVESAGVDVSPAAVLPLALVLNELCTNALKYGALSMRTGRVAIAASVDAPQQQFRLSWNESGGPRVAPPTRQGFGSDLIDRIVRQLSGQADLAFAPAGVTCIVAIPLLSLSG
jgi:two-component sensor histidine kinase